MFNFSKVFAVHVPILNTGFSIVPNPAKYNIQILINNSINKSANIQIADITGRIVIKQELPVMNGIIKVNTNNLQTGTYFIKMILMGETYSDKLLIMK